MHKPDNQPRRKSALPPLLLLVPVPTIGVFFGMVIEATAGTWIGDTIYIGGKIWLVLLPAVWRLFVEKQPPSWSPPKRGGFGMGIATGLLMSAAIFAAYFLLAEHVIDPETVEEAAADVGIDQVWRFLLLAVYICTINAVLEEYVWRWFCFRQCERLVRVGWIAVALSAAFFTLHHVFALATLVGPIATALGSLGVFIGGCVWSWMYLRYRSIWPGFVSHVIVDIVIFIIGWQMIMQ